VPLWAIIVLVVLFVIVDLAIAGAILNSRRRQREAATFQSRVVEVNEALAAAHAQDNGWDPAVLRDTARAIVADRHPGTDVVELHLVEIDDRPGVEDDRAVFHVITADATLRLALARNRAGEWHEESLEPLGGSVR
jgi:hypothetical protein